PFTLTARQLGFEITSVSPTQAANLGSVTVTIHGSHLTSTTTADLVSAGSDIPATRVFFQDSYSVFATFNIAGANPGTYDVRVSDGGQSNTAPGAFSIRAGGIPGYIVADLDVPRSTRIGHPGIVTVSYRNAGNTDVPVSDLLLHVNNALLHLPGDSLFLAN